MVSYKYLLFLLRQVRKVDMLDGVTITRSEKVKDELVLDGNDIELVSRSAALINQVSFSFSGYILAHLSMYVCVYVFHLRTRCRNTYSEQKKCGLSSFCLL